MWAALGGAGGLHVGLLLGGARGLHSSPVSCGKNLLKKFASKTKKKFWYEGPSLGSHLTHKPSQLASLTKSTSKRARREDHVRLRALNGLLYKALTELLCTPEVSQELCDLNVELSKVSLTSDFSACRVFWRTTVSEAQNANMEAVLQRSAAHMRHLLMSQQTLRNMPPIVFVQDKRNAALVEVDRLLAIADFGPPDEKDFVQNDFSAPEALDTTSPCDTLGPTAPSSLYGIDHEALNKQILEYKRRREKGLGSVGPAWLEHTAELMRKRKAKPRMDDDLSPKDCLWETGSDEPLDDGALPEEHTPGKESIALPLQQWQAPNATFPVGIWDQVRCPSRDMAPRSSVFAGTVPPLKEQHPGTPLWMLQACCCWSGACGILPRKGAHSLCGGCFH